MKTKVLSVIFSFALLLTSCSGTHIEHNDSKSVSSVNQSSQTPPQLEPLQKENVNAKNNVDIKINGTTATYTDNVFGVEVAILNYKLFEFEFPPYYGEGIEIMPLRSFVLTYVKDGDNTRSNKIHINAWNSYTSYFADCMGEQTEIITNDGTKGFIRKEFNGDRVLVMFALEGNNGQYQFPQIEVDFDLKAYTEIEDEILSIFKSLKSLR